MARRLCFFFFRLFVLVLRLFLNDARPLMMVPVKLLLLFRLRAERGNGWIRLRLVPILLRRLRQHLPQRNVQETCEIHEANGKLRRNVLVFFPLRQLFQVAAEMALKLLHGLQYLLSLLPHDGGVLQVRLLHKTNLIEQLHVLPELQADQVREREQRLIILVAHIRLVSLLLLITYFTLLDRNLLILQHWPLLIDWSPVDHGTRIL